jgi:hypothetical protein
VPGKEQTAYNRKIEKFCMNMNLNEEYDAVGLKCKNFGIK